MGGPEILGCWSPHFIFKLIFSLKMGGPGLMGGPTSQMGGPAFQLLIYIILSLSSINQWIGVGMILDAYLAISEV